MKILLDENFPLGLLRVLRADLTRVQRRLSIARQQVPAYPSRLLGRKWVLDADPSRHLTVGQVFGPEDVTSQFRSRLDDHRVPETQFGFLLKRDRGQDIPSRRREHLPRGELANSISSFVN